MSERETQTIDIENFANMVGFPVELIKKELFQDNENQDNITMDSLRAAMLKYIDKTMMSEE